MSSAFVPFIISRLFRYLIRLYRAWQAPKPCRHGLADDCKWCKSEADQRAADKLANSAEGRRAEAERYSREIESKFNGIDENTRNRLRAIVEERIRRLDLVAGDLEVKAAIVRLHQKSQSWQNDGQSQQEP